MVEDRVAERAADGDEAAAAAAALSLIHGHSALAKTVRNSDWLSLLRRLKASGCFRTSASLLPPSGHMHLYGRVRPGAVGLIFDGGAVDLQHALCWPSGVFAKTEHHLHVGADGTVTLSGPCRRRLSSLEGLRAANEEADRRHAVWQHAGGERPEPSLYNEVSVELSGKDVAAIFVRSHEERHLVLALGLRSLFRHLFCGRPLPLLRITPEGGASVVAHDEQLALLSAACAPGGLPWACDASGVAPRLPIDASDFPELQPQQRLALHASLGLTHASLRASLAEALSRPASDQPVALAPLIASCLVAAASSGNVASAREIVRVSAPLLLASVAPPPATAATAPVPASAPAPAGQPASCSHPESCQPLAEPLLPPQPLAPSNAYAEWSGGGSSALESVGTLQRACATVRSDAMLVPLGAQITLAEFVSGGTARRLDGACEWIEEWLRRSEADAACPSPASLAFRFASWLEARRVDGNSDWLSFLTGRALRNRRHFLGQLYALRRSASDGQAYVAQLFAITSRLRQPCLRLRILQQVLGLDERFSRDIVHGVICLACDVVESMATRAPSREPRPHSPPGEVEPPGAGGAARVSARKATIGLLLSLDDFDEATRLEADALFFPGPGSPRPRPSDPVGESERRSRVEHFYRDGSAPVLVGTAPSPS